MTNINNMPLCLTLGDPLGIGPEITIRTLNFLQKKKINLSFIVIGSKKAFDRACTYLNINNKSIHYHKIWAVNEGNKFQSRIKEYTNQDFIALVVNFVDILAHKSSQMDVLKEMIPDETGYRLAVKNWLEQSWLLQVLIYF